MFAAQAQIQFSRYCVMRTLPAHIDQIVSPYCVPLYLCPRHCSCRGRPNHQSTVDDGSSGGAMDRRLPSQDNNLGSRSRSHEDELIAGSNWKRRSGSRDPDQDLDRDRDYNEERRMGQKRFRGESHRETHAADGRGIDRQRDTQERGRGRDRDAEGIRERDRRRGRDERLARLGTGVLSGMHMRWPAAA